MIHISCVTNETVNLKVRFPSNQHHRPIKFCHSLGRNEQILEHWQFYSSHKSSHTVPRYPCNRSPLFRLRARFFQLSLKVPGKFNFLFIKWVWGLWATLLHMFSSHFDFISIIAQTQGNMDSQPRVKAAMFVDNILKVFRRLYVKMEFSKVPRQKKWFCSWRLSWPTTWRDTCKVTIVFEWRSDGEIYFLLSVANYFLKNLTRNGFS